jgi:hypothetical protein
MPKAVIHIGTDKTGSTYIQHVCTQARSELAVLGIGYPAPRDAAFINHVHFAMAHGFARHVPATDVQSVGAWDAMADERPDPRQTLLLSSEHFSHDRSDATIGRLKTWLGANGYDDVRIVVFLRNQVSWLISAYGQDIKGGSTRTIDDFHRKRARWMAYSNLLGPWASAFGHQNVIPLNYDSARQADPQHGIMDALWSAVGIEPGGRTALASRREVRDNAQPSQVLLETMRRCGPGPASAGRIHDFAIRTMRRWSGAGQQDTANARIWPLPADFLAALPAMQRDNDAIAHSFGMPRLPDLRAAAQVYQAGIVAVPEQEAARCAALLRLGAAMVAGRTARLAGAA